MRTPSSGDQAPKLKPRPPVEDSSRIVNRISILVNINVMRKWWCWSERADLKKMEEEYERLLKNGDLKAPSLGDEIQKRCQRFNALINVYKDVQLILDKTQL